MNNKLYETKGAETMIIYPGENEVKLVQSTASASTLISSITGEIKEYVASKFPRGFFKSVYIDTAETIHAQNRNRKHNENLNKIQYPNIAITPEITLDDPIGGMEKQMHMSSPNLYLRQNMRQVYQQLVVDPTEKFALYYTSDYITVNFNFRITTNKYIQNVDLAYYMKSRFQLGMFQYLNDTYLDAEIPKTYIRMIADMLGLDINSTTDMDELRLYLISNGLPDEYIKKKINAGTGKDCFFLSDKRNLLINILDMVAPLSIIRDDMSVGEYTINFRVQVSTWLPNAFIMSLDPDQFNNLSSDTMAQTLNDEFQEQNNGFYSISLRNIKLNRHASIYFETSSGEQVIGQEIFHNVFTYNLDEPVTYISIADYLKDDFKKVHAYMMDKNFDLRDLMVIKMHNRDGEFGTVKLEAMDYYLGELPDNLIDYENLTIQNIDSNGQDFSASIHLDRTLFESILKAIELDRFFFNDSALATFRINHYIEEAGELTQQEFKVPVYSFTSEKDLYSKASQISGYWRLNTFRVYTPYGIGFVGLVEEGDPRASEYKICVGYNNNEPIIRCLEKI